VLLLDGHEQVGDVVGDLARPTAIGAWLRKQRIEAAAAAMRVRVVPGMT
jgi:hypothetical protein